jgi:hypothetical protein
MRIREEWKPLALIVGVLLVFFWLPLGNERFARSIMEALSLARWYTREHVLLCLVPAFFIAGAISVFVSQEAVMKYLGARANKVIAYGVASVSGTVLAVCSCTVLPLFAGIYKRGGGLGPATAFLYSGPAINVLAIVLTARILGLQLGVARAVGAIGFSVVIGLLMALIFRGEEEERVAAMALPKPEVKLALWKNATYMATMVAVLVFANWGKPVSETGAWHAVYSVKWILTDLSAVVFGLVLVAWFNVKWSHALFATLPTVVLAFLFPSQPMIPFAAAIFGLVAVTNLAGGETEEWLASTWGFTKQILPLLLGGVLVSGFFLGSPGGMGGVIPPEWVQKLVGGNSLGANFFASIVGAFMYFATLTEVPIVQGLIGSGMGKGPALALLLAGPALSLPSMLVIGSIMGAKKAVTYITLVVVMATITGVLFGIVAS